MLQKYTWEIYNIISYFGASIGVAVHYRALGVPSIFSSLRRAEMFRSRAEPINPRGFDVDKS